MNFDGVYANAQEFLEVCTVSFPALLHAYCNESARFSVEQNLLICVLEISDSAALNGAIQLNVLGVQESGGELVE